MAEGASPPRRGVSGGAPSNGDTSGSAAAKWAREEGDVLPDNPWVAEEDEEDA